MKKIAYIEIDTHAEIAQNFMELMKGSEKFSVDYYFSEKILKQIGKHQVNLFVTESSVLLDQLKSKEYEMVIIGTVHRYFNIFERITAQFNTSVIVHNLNFTKISRFQLLNNILRDDFSYRLKLLLKEGLLSAPEVYHKAKNLLVLDENLGNEKLKFLPLFFNKCHPKKASETFTVVIPGTVSQQRRDYISVLKKIQNFQTDVQIIFLGKAAGKELEWLKNFEKVQPENIEVQYFTEKVPPSVFDKWMKSADVLWCPLQNDTSFFSNPEIYGKTKMSGNIGDAIKYGKPALFPENYAGKYPFIFPEKSDIEEQLHSCSHSVICDFQEKFSKENVRKGLEEILNSLLKT
ncbi:hypothetical protein [Chryseobacterium sp.]|uniref:hypothetical protein n=1 Tax=Chryseobacterium sp. TaxID=1871047 RepID=UPI0011C8CE0E|nr:hypothetical protein [Chryseobacterium sp.]TXF75020.1 hypothetical protein FUA25_12125 [Chryseobacterium sp.]